VTNQAEPATTSSSPRPALFVVFEGIDGSGKTTISNRVADRLSAAGLRVSHVRAGGVLASNTAENIRQLTRDQRNLALSPYAEFLMYVARETQQLDECIRPALESADVIIADRFLYTSYVLATSGRGLPEERIAPVVSAAAGGLQPGLTILIDVDPQVARARRKADKVARPTVRTSSRKGLSGAGLLRRLREGYQRLAAASTPASPWVVVDNSTSELDAVVRAVTDLVSNVHAGATPPATLALPSLGPPRARDPEHARHVFLAWIDAEAVREPEVAAHLLAGTYGDGYDDRRWALVDRTPSIIANGLAGLDDAASYALREHLRHAQPALVAKSLGGTLPDDEVAWQLRERLIDVAPDGVAVSLGGQFSERAWTMRRKLWPIAPARIIKSLTGDDGEEAWSLREQWLASIGGEPALAASEQAKIVCRTIRGLGGERAWQLRELALAVTPANAITSLEGIFDERAWTWRTRHIDRAPVPVLSSIRRSNDDRAWALRDRVKAVCKEVLDSISGMDDPRAWALREELRDAWPSTAVKSLGALGLLGRGREFTIGVLAKHGDLSLLRHAAALSSEAPLRVLVEHGIDPT
jgi:dTMP kinase